MIAEESPELAKYKISYTDDGPTESLTQKLAQVYADRSLTKSPIIPADQRGKGQSWSFRLAGRC